MKSLLFIDYTFHKKTKSADFMVELLAEHYQVTLCHIDPDVGGEEEVIRLHAGSYDAIACWQVMPDMRIVRRHIRYRHAVLFPMADACPSAWKIEKWYPFRNFHIICFCAWLHRRLSAAGLCASYVQYFPQPNDAAELGDPDSAFFWARRENMTRFVAGMLDSSAACTSLHVHIAPDPGQEIHMPPNSPNLAVTTSSWINSKQQLHQIIEKHAFYIAPRFKEGIGMSFLEAMAIGRCVIAPDSPTMNEYIKHGVNGLLYNPSQPSLPTAVDVRALQAAALRSIIDGKRRWDIDMHLVLAMLSTSPKASVMRLHFRLLARSLKNPYKVLRMLCGAPIKPKRRRSSARPCPME